MSSPLRSHSSVPASADVGLADEFGNSQPASLPRQNYRHQPDSRNSGGSQPILGDGNYATPASGERRSVGHMSGRRAMRTTPRTGQYALFNPRRASSAMASPFPNAHTQEESESRSAQPQNLWGTAIDAADMQRRFSAFLRTYTRADGQRNYMQIIQEMVDNETRHMDLDCMDLYDRDRDLYEKLVQYPSEVIYLLDQALGSVAQSLGARNDEFQVEAHNLRDGKAMRDLNPSDIDTLISIKGMVTRTSGIIPEMYQASFVCQACHGEVQVSVSLGKVEEPLQCEHCHKKFTLRLMHNHSLFSNKQMIKVQESPDQIPEGETPHTCTLFSVENCVDICKPGDRVTVTGIYKATPVRVNPRNRSVKSIYKTHIDVLHVEVEHNIESLSDLVASKRAACPDDEDEHLDASNSAAETFRREMIQIGCTENIYQQLADSIAPSIFGMEDTKKGILCQLFGGVRKEFPGGCTRGELNVLMVGDPGVSKSQLLNYVHKIAPRGIYTSGRGSSAVGLTAYVTKDPETREMVLESGALVLSDLGVCCIDEFDKMSESARSMLHEVMEQQTVSVAKAGIISTLNARTSVLAAANPSGSRYDRKKAILDNISLPPSLVSRFDLVYLVLDEINEQQDHRLAKHLVSMHFENPPIHQSAKISSQKMRQFISYARQECHPRLSEEAAGELVKGYVEMRAQGAAAPSQRTRITATPRQLESLIRISEALARMRLAEEVTPSDVAEAIRLMKEAWHSSAIDPTTGHLDMSMINTGISETDREIQRMLPSELQKLLEGMDERTGTIRELRDKLSLQNISCNSQQIVNALSGIGSVAVSGGTWRRR